MTTITAKEFDEKFDRGEDISEHLDFSKAKKLKDMRKHKTDTKKVNVDFKVELSFIVVLVPDTFLFFYLFRGVKQWVVS